MTLVADVNGLALRAEQEDIQALAGVVVGGFNPAVDHPLNWGLEQVTPRQVGAIGNALVGPYLANARANLGGQGGFSPVGALVTDSQLAWTSLSTLYNPLPGYTVKNLALDGDVTITDNRTSRLYVSLDLNEWVEFFNRDVVHLVLNTWAGFSPLGQSTVWLRSDAWVRHNHGKTAKVFLQGRIAERLQQQLIEGDAISPQDFVNKILDADAESAYSSTSGPC